MTAIFAVIIASISLAFNLIQWISRNRPYIGIANLEWDTISGEHVFAGIAYPDSVRCTIKNVGEIPAKVIYLSGTIEAFGYGTESNRKTIQPQGIGVLFPGQEVEIVLSFDIDSDGVGQGFVAGDGYVEIDSTITYEGYLFLRWHKKHETEQEYIIFQSPASWRTLASGNYS